MFQCTCPAKILGLIPITTKKKKKGKEKKHASGFMRNKFGIYGDLPFTV
jgi:hypothetical protein